MNWWVTALISSVCFAELLGMAPWKAFLLSLVVFVIHAAIVDWPRKAKN